MDFKQLEAFVKIIELGSFSKAADAIYMSQPSVSTYISALEKELDASLLNRSTKEVSPTLAGKIFYENAKELLALKHNSMERIKNLSGNFSGEISILASSVPSLYILPRVIADFTAEYPDVFLSVRLADTLEVSRGIASGQAEIGFSGGVVDNGKCIFTEFAAEKMIFIAPPNCGFSAEREYSLEEIMYNYPFISRELGSGTRTQYESFFSEQGVRMSDVKICASFDNTQSIINAAASGLGVSVVSEIAARTAVEHGIVTRVNLRQDLPERKLYYVLRKNISISHLVELFIEFSLRFVTHRMQKG